MKDIETARFLNALAKDPATVSALVLAVGDRQGDDACQAVATVAQSHGFDIDAADALRVHLAFVQAQDAGRDLADSELTGVNGGVQLAQPLPGPPSPSIPGPPGILGTIVALGQTIDPSLNLFKGW